MLGYVIGAYLYDTVGHWLIDLYGYASRMDAVKAGYDQWGWLFILVKGLTPIPYKLVTIVSGLLAYNFPLFVLLCAITRGARVSSFFWIQSLIREDARRALLFDMDMAIQRAGAGLGQGDAAVISLTGAYHNLLRMWAEP